jgi:hypothetical protein
VTAIPGVQSVATSSRAPLDSSTPLARVNAAQPVTATADLTSTTVSALVIGIRYFDVRCRHYQDSFLIYHGSIDQNQTFDDVLATMSSFLDAHPGETVIASVKEGRPADVTCPFEDTFASYVAQTGAGTSTPAFRCWRRTRQDRAVAPVRRWRRRASTPRSGPITRRSRPTARSDRRQLWSSPTCEVDRDPVSRRGAARRRCRCS